MSSDRRPRVLIRESIAESGLELLRERFDVVEDTDSDLGSIIGEFEANRRSLGDDPRRRADRAGKPPEGDRAGRGGGRQRRRGRGDAARDRGRERTRGDRGLCGRAHHRAAASPLRGTSPRPTPRSSREGGSAGDSPASSSRERPSASWASGGSAGRSRAARSVSACGSSPTTRTSRSTASGSSESSPPRHRRTLYARVGSDHAPPPAQRPDARAARTRCVRAHARRRSRRERRSRRSDRRGCARRCAPLGEGGGRGARRLRVGAVCRAAARARAGRRDAASRRLDHGSPGSGGPDHRRAGGGSARRRARPDGRQHPGRRAGRPRGARRVHPARREARAPGNRARSGAAEHGSWWRRTVRSPSTTPACSRSPP